MTAALKVRDVGDPFPGIRLPSVHGDGLIDVGAFRGRRVLVFSWSSW